MSDALPPIAGVIFDWGGTLTPWHAVDLRAQWEAFADGYGALACARDDLASSLLTAEDAAWARSRELHRSSHLDDLLREVGLDPGAPATRAGLAAYRDFWEPHTITYPQVEELFERLRERGLAIGVLSNTIWSGDYHRSVFLRDGVDHLIDADLYSCETPWTKPHPSIFHAAALALDLAPEQCVYVGDRLYEDVHGAHRAGLRAILVPHSDIPADQLVDVDDAPDGVAHDLLDVLSLVDSLGGGPAVGVDVP